MAEAAITPLIIDRTKNGLAILIGSDYKETSEGNYGPLTGPTNDIKLAEEVFSSFGAQCVILKNKAANEIRAAVAGAAKINPSCKLEWIVVLFTGHGSINGELIANDGHPVYLEPDIIDPFQPKNAIQIAQLPKMFFIDACRGRDDTEAVIIPKGAGEHQVSRGGELLKQIVFPKEGNIMVAYSTLPNKLSYDDHGGAKWKGLWINTVLTNLQKESLSVTDILQNVNKEVLKRCQDRHLKLQQPELHSTLLGTFSFKKPAASGNTLQLFHQVSTVNKVAATSAAPTMKSEQGGTQYTSELSMLVKEKKIKKREYTNFKKNPGNHVQLIVRFNDGKTKTFNSKEYDSSFASHNEAQEKVAKEAVHFIRAQEAVISKCSYTPDVARVDESSCSSDLTIPRCKKPDEPQQQEPSRVNRVKPVRELELKRISTMKDTEILQELKNVVDDRGKCKISSENYTFSTVGQSGNFICTFSHPRFPLIVGDPKESKQKAKQSVARKVLQYYYKNYDKFTAAQ